MATVIPNEFVFDPAATPSTSETIFKGLLSKDELAVWVGHEKSRKTTVGLKLAVCAALGRDFLGFRFAAPCPLRVVMFDFESKDDSIHRRYRRICEALRLSDEQCKLLAENLEIVELKKMRLQGVYVPKIDRPAGMWNGQKVLSGKDWWTQAAAEYPADLYLVDPLRNLHGAKENGSEIEEILGLIHSIFKTVILPHHMTKESQNPKDNAQLSKNMRLFSEGCRGSGAIKGYADVIICQQHTVEHDVDTVWFGAFMKDAADVDPIPLVESPSESFNWDLPIDVPDHLRKTLEILLYSRIASWPNRTAVVETLVKLGLKEKTAYRHIKQLIQRRFLQESHGKIILGENAKRAQYADADDGCGCGSGPSDGFDPYTVLGINFTATDEEIESAYREGMLKYHPDKGAKLGPEWQEFANQKARDLNRAYEMLGKPRGSRQAKPRKTAQSPPKHPYDTQNRAFEVVNSM